MTGKTFGIATETYSSGGQAIRVIHETNEKFDGTSRMVLAFHGHSGDASQFDSNALGPGYPLVYQLVKTGRYIVISCDGGTLLNSWNNDAATAASGAYEKARDFGRSAGAKTGNYGLLAWSMGGGQALQYLKNHKSEIACQWLWAPSTSLDYAHATGSTYPPEIDTAYAQAAAAYPGAAAGHRVNDEFVTYTGTTGIGRVCHALDDATIPISLSQAFIAAMDSKWVMTTIPSGGHTGLFAGIGTADFLGFFDAGTW